MISNYNYIEQYCLYLAGNIDDYQFDEINQLGARNSGKTYANDEGFGKIIAVAEAYNKKVALYGFRKLSSDKEQMILDFQQALDDLGFIESDSKLSIKNGHYIKVAKGGRVRYRFASGSFVEFAGVYKSTGAAALKGTSSCRGYDLSIVWREEANEFTTKEKQAIEQAIRGAKRMVNIASSNPDSIYQDYITYANDRLKFDRNTLTNKGEQIAYLLESGIRKLFHYTNYQINPHLTKDQINKFNELKELDPVKYEIWGIGMPGGLETSIFSRYMKSMLINFIPTSYYAGIDLGQADSPTGHPTTAILTGVNNEGTKFSPISEFFHSNATMKHKDTYQLADSLINYFVEQSYKIQQITRGLTVFVDYGAGGLFMIDVLKSRARTLPWLQFIPVDKSIWFIKDRVDATIVLLTRQQLQIDKDKTPELFKGMSLMEWKAPSQKAQNYKLEALDKNDDSWDALMYSIMHLIARAIDYRDNKLLMSKNVYNRIDNIKGDKLQW